MRSYLDATKAYAKCLQSQVQLGADLVAASDKLLDDYDSSPMQARFSEVRRITSLMRQVSLHSRIWHPPPILGAIKLRSHWFRKFNV